jgi:hypothetical protein
MALVIFGKSRCAISDKIIKRGDNFICFPPFPSKPTDPLYKCSDGCILRAELESWKYKENVLEASKNFWLQYYASSKVFITIFRDDTYLVLRSIIENKIQIIFFDIVVVGRSFSVAISGCNESASLHHLFKYSVACLL